MDTFTFRLLDANANRAREGLRTAEDFVRFSIGDGFWARRLREFRHALTEAINKQYSPQELLESRRVASDSGNPENAEPVKEISAGHESKQVALRGLKRAQEALRVLEEYSRGHHPSAVTSFSAIRFGLYEAEQWILGAFEPIKQLHAAKLYVLITEALCKLDWEQAARAALKGGAQILQLREKSLEAHALLERSRRLMDFCAKHDALFILNDRVDIAMVARAKGVHLGQSDLAPQEAKRIAGEHFVVGRSTHSVEQAQEAVQKERADYIGVGAMYPTQTKEKTLLRGPKLAQEVCALNLGVPVFAIGGITAERAKELRALGVHRMAVTGAVIGAEDPERAAAEFRNVLE